MPYITKADHHLAAHCLGREWFCHLANWEAEEKDVLPASSSTESALTSAQEQAKPSAEASVTSG